MTYSIKVFLAFLSDTGGKRPISFSTKNRLLYESNHTELTIVYVTSPKSM